MEKKLKVAMYWAVKGVPGWYSSETSVETEEKELDNINGLVYDYFSGTTEMTSLVLRFGNCIVNVAECTAIRFVEVHE